jgi:hypothetical protein
VIPFLPLHPCKNKKDDSINPMISMFRCWLFKIGSTYDLSSVYNLITALV